MEAPSGLLFEKNNLVEDPGDEGLFEGAFLDGKRYKKRAKNEEKSLAYHARNPGPNYSQFKRPEYVDMKGREYKLASGSTMGNLIRSGVISHPEFGEPDLRDEQQLGTQMFWIRIPIHLRGTVPRPNPEGENISLFHIKKQVLAGGFTNGVFFEGKNKTGYVMLDNFTTYGQVADPSPYAHLVDEDKKIKRRKVLF